MATMATTAMAMARRWMRDGAYLAIVSYPFVSAILFLTDQQQPDQDDQRNDNDNDNDNDDDNDDDDNNNDRFDTILATLSCLILYLHVVAMFVTSLVMRMDVCKFSSRASLAHALHLIVLHFYQVLDQDDSPTSDALKLRILFRCVGVVASYLYLAGVIGKEPRATRAAIILFGVFASGCAFSLLWDFDFRLAFRLVLRNNVAKITSPSYANMAAVVAFLFCALTFLNETVTHHTAALLATLVLIVNVTVDSKLDFWTYKPRNDFWTSLRLAADNVPVLASLILMATSANPPPHGIRPKGIVAEGSGVEEVVDEKADYEEDS